jgi:signal transduction histidine kinase
MRRLVGTLRAEGPRPESESLAQVLGSLVDESRARGLPVRLDTGRPLSGIPAEVGGALSRVVQESLTNAQRHARGARSMDVTVRLAAGNAELLIEDDGRGPHAVQWGGTDSHGSCSS